MLLTIFVFTALESIGAQEDIAVTPQLLAKLRTPSYNGIVRRGAAEGLAKLSAALVRI